MIKPDAMKSDNLDFLKNLTIILNNCKDSDEIYDLIGNRIKDLLPDAYIIMLASDEERQYSKVNKIYGLNKTLNLIKKYLKYDPRDYKFEIKNTKLQDLQDYTSGKLVENKDGIYGVSNGKISKVICKTLEKIHKVHHTYMIGFNQDGLIYGTIIIFSEAEIKLSEKNIIEGIAAQASIIIQKKFIEKNLRLSEEKYKQIVENVKVTITLVDRNGQILFINSYGADILQKPAKEIISRNLLDVSPEVVAEKIMPDIINVIDNKKSYEGERQYIINGKTIWYSTKIQPLYDAVTESTVALLITEDISENKKYESELLGLKNSLADTEKLKLDFIPNLSHEIRSIMNGITGFAQLIKETDTLSEAVEYSEIINTNGISLLKIFDEIIDLAKIDSKNLTVETNEFSANHLLDEIFKNLNNDIRIKDNVINLKVVKLAKDIIINTDEGKLKHILINLLDNAVKFTNNGNVEFGYTLKQDKITFYVKDTGIGIDKKNQDKIFTRFFQTEEINTRRFTGAGIGLAIVKGYINALNGSIWVESESGIGAAFYFSVPNMK